MPLSSVCESILGAVAQAIDNLSLTYNPPAGDPVAVTAAVLKVPKVQEGLDAPLPVIAVSPAAERQRVEPASGEGLVFVTYPVEVAISAAGNRDFASDLDVWLNWREQIQQLFQGTSLAGVARVVDVSTDPDPAFDRQSAVDNYDRSRLTVRVKTIEPRGL
jgi:hypothetical protein